MAFLRIEKKNSGSYIRIVKTVRDGAKVSHKTLYSLGKVEDYTPSMLSRMGDKLKEAGGDDLREIVSVKGTPIEELGRFNYGFYLIYSHILQRYGLEKVLTRIERRHKLGFSLVNSVLLMLIERLHDPVSKRGNYLNQGDYLGIEPVGLHQLYRSLDRLAENQDHIQRQIFQRDRNLFNQVLDVVFYDVTTFYFHSEDEQEDKLRQKGFGKDGKVGKTQVVFGLLIDRDKNPVGYQLYKGDQYEGHTFSDAIARLKERYAIEKVVVVADRGMLSKANVGITSEAGYEFIMGERLKSLPEPVKAELIDPKGYQDKWSSTSQDPVEVSYRIIKHEEKIIIGTYNEKRAKKDRKEREERLLKAEKLLKSPSRLKRKAQRFFLKQTGEDKYEIDTERIKAAEKYDGYLAISTNSKDLHPETVLDHYHHLYQIEQTFRTFKSYLETRPMFHWTDKRIEGHLCLCYIAYALLNHLRQRAKKHKFTENELRKVMSKMQVSLIEQLNEQYFLRSKRDEREENLLKALKITPLPNLTPVGKIEKYIPKL